MQIGDYVRLKDIPQNDQRFLEAYKNKTGKVIDKQTLISHKTFLRVLFGALVGLLACLRIGVSG